MTEFLVEIEIVARSQEDREAIRRLVPEERTIGRRLVEQGHIVRIWRIPGRSANVGIWQADDVSHLHQILEDLPHRPWLDIVVRPLSTHPLEESPPES